MQREMKEDVSKMPKGYSRIEKVIPTVNPYPYTDSIRKCQSSRRMNVNVSNRMSIYKFPWLIIDNTAMRPLTEKKLTDMKTTISRLFSSAPNK